MAFEVKTAAFLKSILNAKPKRADNPTRPLPAPVPKTGLSFY
tara:strand:+ start:177 stop:302 length:126 start_codon:yes stop_codon:yes gene_type:complete